MVLVQGHLTERPVVNSYITVVFGPDSMSNVTIYDNKPLARYGRKAELLLSVREAANLYDWANVERPIWLEGSFGKPRALQIPDAHHAYDEGVEAVLCARVYRGQLHVYRCYFPMFLARRLSRIVLGSSYELDDLLGKICGVPWIEFYIEKE